MRRGMRRTGPRAGRFSRRSAASAILLLVLAGSLGLQSVERALFTNLPRAPLGEAPLSLLQASADREGGATFAAVTALRTLAPGATLVMGTDDSVHGGLLLSPLYAQELALAGGVERAALEGVRVTGSPDREVDGPGFRLRVADGPVGAVLVLPGTGRAELVDARLTTGWDGRADGPAVPRGPGPERSVGRDVAVDTTIIVAMLLGGGLMLPRRAIPGLLRLPMALTAGVALQATLGVLLLPWQWSAAAFVVAAGSAWALQRRRGELSGWSRGDLPGLLAAAITTSATAVAVRNLGLLSVSNDSFQYWAGASALSRGELDVAMLEVKRGLALQSLHAPGFGLGADGVLSIGPVLLIAAISMLVLLPRHAALGGSRVARTVGVGLGALVAGSGWFWFNALYLNSHLLVAVLLLSLVTFAVVGGDEGDVGRLMLPVGIMIIAVVLSRSEAVLVIGLFLLGTLRHPVRWQDWRAAWAMLGVGLLVWNALWATGQREAGLPPTVVLGGLAAGLVMLILAGTLHRVPTSVRTRMPLVVGSVLWAFTLALAFTALGSRVNFFDAMRENLGTAEGGWYLTAPLVALLGAFGLAATRDRPSEAPARWLVIGFIPSVLIAKLLDGSQRLTAGDGQSILDVILVGGGRLGWGDSGNRMWTHVALAALVLVILAARRDDIREAPATVRPASSSRLSAWADRAPRIAVAAYVVVIAVTASWWQPQHLGPVGPSADTTFVTVDAGRVGPELTQGTVVTQRVRMPTDVEVPTDTDRIQACVSVTLTDLGRPNAGRFNVEVAADDRRSARTHQGRSQRERDVETTCVDLDVSAPLPAHVDVTVEATSGTAGSSVGLLVAPDGTMVSEAVLRVEARSLDPRHATTRAASWALRAAIMHGPTAIGVALLSVLVLQSPRRRPAVPAAPVPRPGSGG